MRHFTIENETNNITVHTSAEAAGAIPNAERFNGEKGLAKVAADWPVSRLVEIWNSLPGVTPVSKFKDRSTAVSRIWKALQGLGTAEPETAPELSQSQPVEAAAEPEIPSPDTPTDVAPQGPHVGPQEETAKNTATPAQEASAAPAGVDVEICSELVRVAARAQSTYWDAVRNLEKAIGFELGDPGDLNEVTVEGLIAQHEARRKPRQRTQHARENSKTAQVIEMLKREGGATLEEIMTTMGWQKHTTRAMLSAGGSLVKNHGLVIHNQQDGGVRRYFIKS